MHFVDYRHDRRYSIRELVLVARRLAAFPEAESIAEGAGMEEALRDVFDFVKRPAISYESWNDDPFLIFAMNHRLSRVCFQDLEDAAAAAAIARVLASLGMSRLAVAVRSRSPLGNGGGEFGLKLSVQSAEVGRRLGDAHAPPPIDPAGPRHGEWDGAEHMGGNRFAGASSPGRHRHLWKYVRGFPAVLRASSRSGARPVG